MNTPCCTPERTATRRLHVSLSVKSVAAAADFYEALLGTPPTKRKDDYAKFELRDPDLVLSLVPESCCGNGLGLDHFGIRLEDATQMNAAAKALEDRGLTGKREQVNCCYADQDKLWVTDPDGNAWEVYAVTRDEP